MEGRPNTGSRFVESPTQRLDRLLHAGAAPVTRGLSPVSLSLAWADWAWHLAIAPGRQMELAGLATRLALDTLRDDADEPPAGEADEDPRFRHEAWQRWPHSLLRRGFRAQEAFWREAVRAPGMGEHHRAVTDFFARQWLGTLTPANGLATNPVVLQTTAESGGANLWRGAVHWWRDAAGLPDAERDAQAAHFVVGRDVAATPGEVVMRNRLVELIRYAPQTRSVHPEPLLIVPSWIMKYYILDLSPHNSLAAYLVRQGHTVYMLSWRNPDEGDAALAMDDYLAFGIFDSLRAIARLHGAKQRVHAMGYCLGGTLLAIAAAAIAAQAATKDAAHDADFGTAPAGGSLDTRDLPPLAGLSLLAAQTDFSEPGELGLFIDESQVGYLDEITRGQGYLTGAQMAGSFQFLHSRELVWTRRMREYLMGEREPLTDLTVWNADTTRLPARMHHEYLTGLYLHNALAGNAWRVGGRAVSLNDVHWPVFMVGTERDHISPWRSVYRLHQLCDAEITFALAAGGHNAGIVSEPGHAKRWYRIATRAAHGPWVDAERWAERAERVEGSWWPAWHEWLAAHSGRPVRAQAMAKRASLGAAPGRYVMQRYTEP